MNIRKLLIPVVALTAMATTSMLFAQDKGKGGGGKATEAAIARYDEALALKADQKTKITAILSKVQADVAALPQEERRTKGGELRQAANKEIRALLTPDQQKKFDAMPPAPSGKKKN